jgi:hypothetical protein
MSKRPPVWRVAAKILNRQARTADKGWYFSLGIGRGVTTPHRKKLIMLRIIHKSLGTGPIHHNPSLAYFITLQSVSHVHKSRSSSFYHIVMCVFFHPS